MRKRIIACVLACAMLLMGAGYAYWTDVTTMTANVDSGQFKVDFVRASADGNNFDYTNYASAWDGWCFGGELTEYGYDDEGYYDKAAKNVVLGATGDDITVTLNNMYPGHSEYFSADVKNNGDVAAKLGQINASLTGSTNPNLDSMLGIAISAEQDGAERFKQYFLSWVTAQGEFDSNSNFVDLGLYNYGLTEDDIFFIDFMPYIRLSSLAHYNNVNDDQLYNMLFLNETNEMEFKFRIGMDPDREGNYTTGRSEARDTTNNDELTEDEAVKLTLGFIWDQYNEN